MNEAYMNVVKHYEDEVVQLTDPKIVKTALKLAYYCAMLDAAIADPLDCAAEQESALECFYDKINELTEHFQELVNEVI